MKLHSKSPTGIFSRLFFPLIIAVALCSATVSNSVNAAENQKPQVSPEGLKLVPDTKKMATVYLREGATFGEYNKVAIIDCYVAFRKNWKRDQNSSLTPFNVSDADMEKMKTELAAEFRKVFTEELTAKGTSVVTTGGTGVLVLRPAIINLDVVAPDTMAPGRSRTYSTSAGQATLFLEVFDSVTGELLARVIDTRAMDDNLARKRNSITNAMDADRMLKGWATTLANYLEQARSSAKP